MAAAPARPKSEEQARAHQDAVRVLIGGARQVAVGEPPPARIKVQRQGIDALDGIDPVVFRGCPIGQEIAAVVIVDGQRGGAGREILGLPAGPGPDIAGPVDLPPGRDGKVQAGGRMHQRGRCSHPLGGAAAGGVDPLIAGGAADCDITDLARPAKGDIVIGVFTLIKIQRNSKQT